MTVSEVQIQPIKPSGGLIAFASCVVDESIYLGSIGVHSRLDGGGYRLTYPTKAVGERRMNYYHPLTKQVAKAIESAVIAKVADLFEKSGDDDRHDQVTNANN